MPLSLKVNTLELPIQQRAKCRKLKNGSNLPIFNVTGLKFCTPPMVHKNEQLLFFDKKNSRPNQTSGSHLVFLQKVHIQTLASLSLKMFFLLLQKHKLAPRGLVWPQKCLAKKKKLLIFVNHWRSAKTGICQTKIE